MDQNLLFGIKLKIKWLHKKKYCNASIGKLTLMIIKITNYFYFLLVILLSSCNQLDAKKKSIIIPQLNTVSFDVVEKNFQIDKEIPTNVSYLLNTWFNEKVKINGIDGKVTFRITDYNEKISTNSDSKRIDISLKFSALIEKPLLSKKKFIEGEVKSYGEIEGSFSMNDFDDIIQKTQTDVILRLSRDLGSKI